MLYDFDKDENIGLAKDRRHTVHVTLGRSRGGEGDGFLASIPLSVGEALPDLLMYEDRIYIKRSDTNYAVAKAFPLVRGVDRVRALDDRTRDTAQDGGTDGLAQDRAGSVSIVWD